MVISQTPLRVSLLGGGTDFRDFFEVHGGAVLSLAITRYIYVIVKERFDSDIYLNYSKKEVVSSVDDVTHDLIREAMRRTGVTSGVEITTLADIPSEGSGLGSSSTVTVGLLNALYAFRNMQVPAERLAREACEIEIDILGKPIGVQDQTIAAHGGLSLLSFRGGFDPEICKIPVDDRVQRGLAENLMLFFTNRTRSANQILREQKSNIGDRVSELVALRDLAHSAWRSVIAADYDAIGNLLNLNWRLKKSLSSGVTDPEIDGMYSRAIDAGAIGGKIAGAGGGGFLLLYCPNSRQDAVRASLPGYRYMPVEISRDGSKIVFNINR